ncbi:MAG: 50S ribosomal protein L3 N(5)-glutamine methyltransferase [Gammaproteobacteria bacterium]|nr:50S ribosomal protein L3 N(5)-glutamine methyltransferase [Gammaproteobacteria bacterium]
MIISDYITELASRLQQAGLSYGHGTDNAEGDAWYLVLCSLNINFDCDESVLQRQLTHQEVALLDARAEKRIDKNIPVAYLVQSAWFAGHRFKIDDRVLIPRSPMAELILNRFEPLLKAEPASILDLCTGSGCIGIACAMEFPGAKVDLVDISGEALQLAQENIDIYSLQQRVQTMESDLFAEIKQSYDLIVCNPPYVSAQEIAGLPAEYHHEPVLGLLSADEGPAVPLKVLRQAGEYLQEDGILLMEVGYSHHALSERLPGVPLLWMGFDNGGEGVFMLTRSQLLKYRDNFI